MILHKNPNDSSMIGFDLKRRKQPGLGGRRKPKAEKGRSETEKPMAFPLQSNALRRGKNGQEFE